jgi:tetratricopeptide (TPR) repeat protein
MNSGTSHPRSRAQLANRVTSRWDAIEQLTDHALVKHDTDSQKVSLHRLVQAEYKFRMSTEDRQEGFDGAVKLVLDKFPPRGDLVIMDSLWEEGAKYLEHISALARDWKDSQGKPEALKPTVDFCNLMANCAWFVHDNDAAGVLSLVMDAAKDAYYKLPEQMKDSLLEADILILLCIRDLRGEGDFKSAEAHGRKSLETREQLGKPQELEKTNCYNYIAVALDSMKRHAEAKELLQKSRDILERKKDELHTRLLCQNNLNFSRNVFSVGQYEEAERKLNEAAVQATSFKSWYSLAL